MKIYGKYNEWMVQLLTIYVKFRFRSISTPILFPNLFTFTVNRKKISIASMLFSHRFLTTASSAGAQSATPKLSLQCRYMSYPLLCDVYLCLIILYSLYWRSEPLSLDHITSLWLYVTCLYL